MNSKKLKFVIGSLVIIAAVIVLAIQGMKEDTTMSYSKSVSEVQMLGARAHALTLKVNGDFVCVFEDFDWKDVRGCPF